MPARALEMDSAHLLRELARTLSKACQSALKAQAAVVRGRRHGRLGPRTDIAADARFFDHLVGVNKQPQKIWTVCSVTAPL
jgi:hypothetical protein